MDGFDLNIQNYTIKELKGLLSLGDVYDTYDVSAKKESICKKVSTDDTITIDMKIKMNNFIESVSKILLNLVDTSSSSSNYSLVKRRNGGGTDDTDDTNDKINDNTPFTDLKNIMQKGSNNLIIQDPFSAHIRKIDNNDNPGSNFDQYGTKRGVINPLLKNTILRGLNIDSRYRDDYYTTQSTDLSITLPYKIENVISYRLVSVTIPITYYNISQKYGNNVIRIETYASILTSYILLNTFDLILQDGIYNTTQTLNIFSASIETEINNILNSNPNSPNNALPAASSPNPKLVYTINRVNGKSVFAQDVTATQVYYFKIITNVGLNITTGQVEKDFDVNKGIITRLGWTLGFRTAEHYSSNYDPFIVPPATIPNVYGSIVSPSICFTKYPIYGFLSIDDFNSNVNDYYTSVFANSISVPNILSKVDLTRLIEISGAFQAAQGESTSNSVNRERRFFGPVNIQKLRITLYDDLGYIIDLNGMDWSVELAFECVYSM
jgi:hypothetical protein